jgi:hypothetical protein
MPRKKEPTWDEIGASIGKKIEKEFKGAKPCKPWEKPWVQYKEHGGGFGRFLFIVGMVLLFNHQGLLVGVPWWILLLIVIGFSAMKF